MRRVDVVVVGAGIGGSILARALRRQGRSVVLIERGRHPRFALGESSTPLGALSLERLAAKYQLADLDALAAHGRWLRRYPHLGRGLKRGFTFFDHRSGPPSLVDRSSLLVAASPNDRVADSHWLRADVDHHLVRRAVAEEVEYLDRTRVLAVEADDDAIELELDVLGGRRRLRAAHLVDASGRGGLVREHLAVGEGPPLETRAALLYGHFRGVRPLADALQVSGSLPYPPGWAAVHHLVPEGWIYELRFDDGLVSAGALLTEELGEDAPADWGRLLAGSPALKAAFAEAEALFPVRREPTIQHRLEGAAGARWVALPHTYAFVDPLFSTGIAWTLRAVERLAELLGERQPPPGGVETGLRRYSELLRREAERIDTLVSGAYAAMDRFEHFAAHSMAYFAAVSWAEARERLLRPPRAHWECFLGGDDRCLAGLFDEARDRLTTNRSDSDVYWRWILDRVAPRDVAGLDLYARTLRVPVDLDVLVDRAALLGLDAAEIRRLLPRLRGDEPGSGAL